MEHFLRGKCVVITGAFGVLGTAVSHAMLEAGATVAGIDRMEKVNAPVSSRTRAWAGVDLGDTTAARTAFDSIVATFGGIDALINIAGGFRWETLSQGSIETWTSCTI